jgi:hypothetical protein
MRAFAVLLAAGILATVANGPPSALAARARHRSVRHTPVGERILLRNSYGVISDRHIERPGPNEETTDAYFGCLKRVGRRFTIGRGLDFGLWGEGKSERGFRLDGPYVTFVWSAYSRYLVGPTEKVEQYDLRSGRRTFVVFVGTGVGVRAVDPSSGSGSEPELAVARDGHAAWPERDSLLCGGQVCYYESLVVHDKGGAHPVATYRRAAGSTDVEISGIAVTAHLVTWVHRGEKRSAPLS